MRDENKHLPENDKKAIEAYENKKALCCYVEQSKSDAYDLIKRLSDLGDGIIEFGIDTESKDFERVLSNLKLCANNTRITSNSIRRISVEFPSKPK